MKMIRIAAAAVTLVGQMAVATPASANGPPLLGWNSSLTAACIDVACTTVQLTLQLNGLEPFDNSNVAVPADIVGLNSLGFVSSLTLDTDGSAGVFSTANVTSGGTWSTNITNGNLTVFNDAIGLPLPSAPVVILATFTAGGAKAFDYSGLAYLDPNQALITSNNGLVYQTGDFQGITSTSTPVPEPISMTLLASGLVGVGAARRRKKKAGEAA